MRSLAMALVAVLLAASTTRGDAGEPPKRFDVGASLGYALPLGSTETGSSLTDTTFGVVPVELDASYRLNSVVGLGVLFRYGASIPTLCATASDCESSIGQDIAIALRARFLLPRLGPVRPLADAGIGYEWFASKLTDNGVTSTRGYRGPLLFTGSIAAPFRLSQRWTLGPVWGFGIGMFTNHSLKAPAIDRTAAVHGMSAHAWLSLSGRVAVSF